MAARARRKNLECPAAIRQCQCRTSSTDLARVGSCAQAATTCSLFVGLFERGGVGNLPIRARPRWVTAETESGGRSACPVTTSGLRSPGEAPSREWQVEAMVRCAREHCPDSGMCGRDCRSVVWCSSVVCGLGGSALLVAQGCPRAPRCGAAAHVVGFRPPTDLPRRRWALILGLHALCILPACAGAEDVPACASTPVVPRSAQAAPASRGRPPAGHAAPLPERILAPRRPRLPLAERDAACGR